MFTANLYFVSRLAADLRLSEAIYLMGEGCAQPLPLCALAVTWSSAMAQVQALQSGIRWRRLKGRAGQVLAFFVGAAGSVEALLEALGRVRKDPPACRDS